MNPHRGNIFWMLYFNVKWFWLSASEEQNAVEWKRKLWMELSREPENWGLHNTYSRGYYAQWIILQNVQHKMLPPWQGCSIKKIWNLLTAIFQNSALSVQPVNIVCARATIPNHFNEQPRVVFREMTKSESIVCMSLSVCVFAFYI